MALSAQQGLARQVRSPMLCGIGAVEAIGEVCQAEARPEVEEARGVDRRAELRVDEFQRRLVRRVDPELRRDECQEHAEVLIEQRLAEGEEIRRGFLCGLVEVVSCRSCGRARGWPRGGGRR